MKYLTKVTEVINIHLVNWPNRVAVGCVIGVNVHPSGAYSYPYPIMKLPIVMPQAGLQNIRLCCPATEVSFINDAHEFESI